MKTPVKTPANRRAWLVGSCLALALGMAAEPVWARGAAVESASKEQKAEAKKELDEGKQAFDGKQFEAALAKFRASYEIVASPNSHLMIARALSELGRYGEAYQDYEGTVEEASKANDPEKYGKTLETAKEERDALRGKLGFVKVEVDAELAANGRTLERANWGKPIAVTPGSVKLELKTKAGTLAEQQVEVSPGSEANVVLTPPLVSAPPVAANCPERTAAPVASTAGINQRTLALVVGGIGVLGFATYATFAVLNNSQYDDLKSRCAGNVCPESAASDIERGRTYQAVAYAGLGLGIAGVGTGIVLWLTSPSSARAAPQQGKRPELIVGTSSVGVRGRF